MEFVLIREGVFIEDLAATSMTVSNTPTDPTDVANKAYVDDKAFSADVTAPGSVPTDGAAVWTAATADYNLGGAYNATTGAITILDGESVEFTVSISTSTSLTALVNSADTVSVQLTSADGTTTVFKTVQVLAGDASDAATAAPSASVTFGYTNVSGSTEEVYAGVLGASLGAVLVLDRATVTARWLKQ